MEPMRGIDAKFLYSETPTTHMHTLKVVVVPADITYETFLWGMRAQLPHLVPLRRRVVPVPLGLGHPVWVVDPAFDLANHVSRRRVPEPGGPHQLAEVVADIAGRPLGRDKPLWEAVFVEGLAGHESAIVAKVHHAVADGGASAALLGYVGETFTHGPPDHALDGPASEEIPTRRQLLTTAAHQHAVRLRGLPQLVRRSVRGARDYRRSRRAMASPPAQPLQAPRTSLNVSLDARRTFAMTALPLEDLKAIRRATDTTLNDVYLTVCAGALRRYLEARRELPARPLVASVPLSTDGGIGHLLGNQLDNMYVSLATDVDGPLARLQAVHVEAAAAKEARRAFGNELMEQRADVVPPQLYSSAVHLWSRTHLANRLPPPLNVIISNVAGPRQPLAFGPVTMRALYSVGPIVEGVGLNITAWSYVDQLFIGILGCPRSLPDPWAVADLLPQALGELEREALGPRVAEPT
ncbi:MAG TPA: wax ester/triacylglycerol synthase family O-acyltransferase [Acidimicrobiales bacterium]|nr:wax ester/triacylglycerol synthase family O-acyltransferase [Acidimicrobiales bacterium]